MKKQLLRFLVSACSCTLFAQKQQASYLAYIEQWKEAAIEQQVEYGIPASITMAQALLESGAGQSELAQNANNHFGIKCSNGWAGATYHHDDETAGECFRKYDDAAQSYKDHSLFLQRQRYAPCFEIAAEDYAGWAQQLRACGYATDQLYPVKLVRLIEDYRLDTIGAGKPVGKFDPQKALLDARRGPSSQSQTAQGQAQGKRPLKAAIVRGADPIMVIHNEQPEPVYVEPMTAREERDTFLLHHPKKRHNGVFYVVAIEGETYANVAFRLNVRERDLREDNDALGRDLAPGDRIYLAPKKQVGTQDYVWTRPGESLWKICQDEAIQIEAVHKLNEDLDPHIRVFRTRQKLYLRKVKDDGLR